MDKLGVACFSEPPDDIPMWAYYADSQRGVCLRFVAPLLLKWEGCLPPIPVSYLPEYPEVQFYQDTVFDRTRLTVGAKAKVWEHEREWRIVRSAGRGPHRFDPAALDGIILGCGVSERNEERIRKLVAQRDPPIDVLRARPAERAFKLDIVPA
jgi:hypothetical protein